MTSSMDEAYTQHLALNHSIEKYLLIDSSKIGKDDFSSFCELKELNAVLMDKMIWKRQNKLKNMLKS